MRRVCQILLAALLLAPAGGCMVFDSIRTASRQTWSAFKPKGNDYRMSSDEATGEWDFVGKEGRGNRPLDKQNDPFRNLLTSPKAREIEENLGYGN